MESGIDIAALRRLRGWTQEELAEHSGLSVRTIRNIELGRIQNPRRSSVEQLVKALGIERGDVTYPGEVQDRTQWFGIRSSNSPLIGQDVKQERLARTVCANRLTTILGSGGVGKTSAALSVAAKVSHFFRNGVAVVELGEIPPERGRVSSQAVSVLNRVKQKISWGEHVDRDTNMLLVLDNAEHVPDGVTAAVKEILSDFPHVHVVVTARRPLTERLGVNQEIRPLAVEPAEGGDLSRVPAVELVLRHVGAGSPVMASLAHDLPSVAELCRRLGGMPRALEFAAERLRSVPIRLLLASGPELALLSTNDHALLPHQRSLAAGIQWSIDLLTTEHRLLLAQLADQPMARFSLDEVTAAYERLDAADLAGRESSQFSLFSDLLEMSLVEATPGELYEYQMAPYVGEVVEGKTGLMSSGSAG
jgi:transcriptional regulator with XRE-family HTH domain